LAIVSTKGASSSTSITKGATIVFLLKFPMTQFES
jgi:hypothetical protein